MPLKAATSITGRQSSANWLLRGLVVFSVALHALIGVHISGIYRSQTLTAIELTLQNIARPKVRDIPRPRPRFKPPPPADPVRKVSVAPRAVPHLKPLDVAPVDADLPDSLVAAISVPEVPHTPGVDSSDWVPGPHGQEAAGEFMTAASYLDMVRLKIESCKRYPGAAKARGIEGRVTIRFVLHPDGTIRDVAVAKRSSSRVLNTAALEAVQRAAPFPRPPVNLFNGVLPLELTIVFELT